MNRTELINLLQKERDYQTKVFGNYKNNPSLNLASFLSFLKTYIDKAEKEYTNIWVKDLPDWLVAVDEHTHQGSAPVKTYEHLIKIFALAGAALETYTEINPEEWREEGVKLKWR